MNVLHNVCCICWMSDGSVVSVEQNHSVYPVSDILIWAKSRIIIHLCGEQICLQWRAKSHGYHYYVTLEEKNDAYPLWCFLYLGKRTLMIRWLCPILGKHSLYRWGISYLISERHYSIKDLGVSLWICLGNSSCSFIFFFYWYLLMIFDIR